MTDDGLLPFVLVLCRTTYTLYQNVLPYIRLRIMLLFFFTCIFEEKKIAKQTRDNGFCWSRTDSEWKRIDVARSVAKKTATIDDGRRPLERTRLFAIGRSVERIRSTPRDVPSVRHNSSLSTGRHDVMFNVKMYYYFCCYVFTPLPRPRADGKPERTRIVRPFPGVYTAACARTRKR